MIRKVFVAILNFRIRLKFKKLKGQINIGENVELHSDIKVSFPSKLNIESYVYIGPSAHIQALGTVTIRRGAIIGPRIKIYSANHNFRSATSIPYDENYVKRAVVIGENVWIGGDVIITPGSDIGEGAIIGAGSVVTGKVPALSIAAGNPIRIISKRDEEHYYRLKSQNKIYLKLKKEGVIKPNYS